MRESIGDMFSKHPRSAVVISTNGFVKFNGEGVMGRGCAKQAADKYPELPMALGNAITIRGNRLHGFTMEDGENLVCFPVKAISEPCAVDKANVVNHQRHRMQAEQPVPGWACKARMEIIKASALELVELTNTQGWEDVICPRFGCGAGELKWTEVKEMLDPILDDRFIIMNFK